MTKSKLVQKKYLGVWQRTLLETATSKDETSLVLWMQAAQYHIDIRIPANRPPLSTAHKLSDYSNDELLQLATQQGFAGITKITPSNQNSSDICQWHRQMDFQPPTDDRDIGKMVFVDENTIIETGLDAPYLEVWRRLPASHATTSFAFVAGKSHLNLETPAYFMRAGNYVAYARPRNVTLPNADSLTTCIATHQPNRETLLNWLDMELSFGEMIDKDSWQIKHSTLPFKQGLIKRFLIG